MLKFPKVDDIYEVRVESNDRLVGYFILDVDGFYYFMPYLLSEGGLWSDYMLLEIGTMLKEVNKPWDNKIKEYFDKEKLCQK